MLLAPNRARAIVPSDMQEVEVRMFERDADGDGIDAAAVNELGARSD